MAEHQGNGEHAPHNDAGQELQLRFQADYQTSFPTVYSNFAMVSHTADDFSLDFCLLAPPYHPNVETKTIPLPVMTRVIIPTGMVAGLIEALRKQLSKQSSEREAGGIIIPVKGQEDSPHDES